MISSSYLSIKKHDLQLLEIEYNFIFEFKPKKNDNFENCKTKFLAIPSYQFPNNLLPIFKIRFSQFNSFYLFNKKSYRLWSEQPKQINCS